MKHQILMVPCKRELVRHYFSLPVCVQIERIYRRYGAKDERMMLDAIVHALDSLHIEPVFPKGVKYVSTLKRITWYEDLFMVAVGRKIEECCRWN